MIGIYRIRNVVNNKCYYGSAKNITRRWSKHKSQLKYGRHENILLQRAWNKYGGENFLFEIVELCTETELLIIEQKYLNINPEYNIGKQASGGDNISNHPNKVNIIESIKFTIKKNNDLLSKEERKEKWGKCGEDNPNWRGGISIKYCECGKQIAPENKFCIKCVPRKGEKNPFFNKKHSMEALEKISNKLKGHKPINNTPIIINGINYESLADASNKLLIPITTIRWRVKSKNKKFENYKYL